MTLKKKTIRNLLIILNSFLILSSSSLYTKVSGFNSTISDEIFSSSCNTTLLWNYTMGDGGRGLSITPNGRFLVVGSWDRNVYFFDTSDPVPLWNKTLNEAIDQVAISAQGEYIVATAYDYKLYLFHKSSSTPIWNFTAGDLIRSVAITPDGEYIVAGSWDDYIYLFDRMSPIPIWNYSMGNNVYTVEISSDGQIIAGGGLGVGVHVFNRSMTTPLLWVNDSMSTVYSIDLSANEKYLLAGTLTGVTGTIFLYDILNPKPIQEFETSDPFGHVSISAEGDYFVGTVSSEHRFYLFERGNLIPIWNFTAEDQIEQAEISGNSNYIACGSYDYRFYLFNRPNINASIEKKEMFNIKTFKTNNLVFSVELSESGEYIAALSNDNNVYMFYNEIGEDSEEQSSISFGNFFLIVVIASISVVLILKLRRIKNKK